MRSSRWAALALAAGLAGCSWGNPPWQQEKEPAETQAQLRAALATTAKNRQLYENWRYWAPRLSFEQPNCQINGLTVPFQHGLPRGFVANMLPESDLKQAGEVSSRHYRDWPSLSGTLIHPASGHLSPSRDTNLHGGGIGKINHVINITVSLAPFGLPTGAGAEMAFLRFYNATIALGKPLKARVTVSLVEALLAGATTMNTVNDARAINGQFFTQSVVQRQNAIFRHPFISNDGFKMVFHLSHTTSNMPHLQQSPFHEIGWVSSQTSPAFLPLSINPTRSPGGRCNPPQVITACIV